MKQVLLSLVCLVLLTACKHDVPFAYKRDVQQGNVLEQADVDKVKVGMTQSQVANLLGMPISRDTFKQHRWDYVYYLKKNHEPVEQRHLTVFFDGSGVVEKIDS